MAKDPIIENHWRTIYLSMKFEFNQYESKN